MIKLHENILSQDPFIATSSNVISDEECQHFINISRKLLKPSLVSHDKKGVVSSGRTG